MVNEMKDATERLLETVLGTLCEHSDYKITVTINGTNSCLVSVAVCSSDYGKVIGQKGKIVKALRTLLQAFAGRYRIRFLFDVSEFSQ
jgi:predicted RNA-binding protein YlqC (UPF0109 family)